jgi:proteasome accessory factor C
MFRIDRIRAMRETGETFTPDATEIAMGDFAMGEFAAGEVYSPRPDDVRVTLALTPEAAWVAESYPTESVTERADGALEIVLAVSEQVWLERLLLRLGPDAEVVAPDELRNVAAGAAQRILGIYHHN